MKYIYSTLFLLSLLATNLFAQQPQDNISAYHHLVEVNEQWIHHQPESPKTNLQFDKDEDRIAYHLELVVKTLQETAPESLSKNTLKKRKDLLEKLADYAAAKQFPINKYHSTRQPYFIDPQGTHCAVGFLMAASGNEELAQQISQKYNYNYIHEMPVKKITPWANEYGFSIDELAWIQPGYPPTDPYTAFPNGPNATVEHIEYANNAIGLVVAGTFSEIGGSPCNQIGAFKNNNFTCLSNGLTGQITNIYPLYNVIYVTGMFQNNGSNYPLASLENGNWTYYAIPGRSGAEGKLAFNGGAYNTIGLVLQHSSAPSKEEFWVLDNNTWQKKLTINGQVNAHASSSEGYLLGGAFDEVTVHVPGQTDVTIACNNLILRAFGTSDNWQALSAQVSDTVKAIKVVGGAAYIGGTCDSGQDVCFTRLLNGILQPLIIYEDYFHNNESCEIRDIENINGRIILGGDFVLAPFVGTYGSHLAEYNLTYNGMVAIARFDQPVNKVASYDNTIFMGGEFTEDETSGNALPYFAKLGVLTSITDPVPAKAISIYPNPVVSFAAIDGLTSEFSYSVFDVLGKELQSGLQQPDTEIDLSGLPDGVFLLTVHSASGQFTTKFIKG